MKNWKTTLGAVIAAVVQLGPIVAPKYISHDLANGISILAAAFGLGMAKDHNVTGGTVPNVPNDASVVKEAAKADKV